MKRLADNRLFNMWFCFDDIQTARVSGRGVGWTFSVFTTRLPDQSERFAAFMQLITSSLVIVLPGQVLP